MNFLQLLKDIEAHIKNMAVTQGTVHFHYHNLRHTEYVVNAAMTISNHYELGDRDFFTVMAATWFHDTGYYYGQAAEHESKSATLAAAFLSERAVEEELIAHISNCILATRMPQHPKGLLEQIVCDADLYHLGTDDFSKFDKLLRKEQEGQSGLKIPKQEWRKNTIRFLNNHHYHTAYCQELLQSKKEENKQQLMAKISDEPETATPILRDQVAPVTLTPLPEQPAKEKKKDDRPERGIETMFRISSNNHQRLSDMADNKAHILITTTSIIISVLLSLLLRKLEDNPYLTFPTLLLLTVCAVSMVFSILATRPSIPKGVFTPEDVTEKRVNLLFFGNFYRMQYEQFDAGMQQVMNDRSFLYGTLTRDLYAQGIVLGRKYRLLRTAYNIFMFGIIASIVSFSIATIFFR